ncbi:MAG: hypothetical protein ACT4PP_07955 [Sporichthyaceae bacterium]
MSSDLEAQGAAAGDPGMSVGRRAALAVALCLTVAIVGAGTWLLGSGSDAAESELSPARRVEEGVKARPPVIVAPPPITERASRSKARSYRTR